MKITKYLRVFGKLKTTEPIPIKDVQYDTEQVTMGKICYFTKREYIRKADGTILHYWTFVLADGTGRLNCVIFPTQGAIPRIELLSDFASVCIVGSKSVRNHRTAFRVVGITLMLEANDE